MLPLSIDGIGATRSLRFNPRLLHHFRPARRFRANKRAELLAAATNDVRTE